LRYPRFLFRPSQADALQVDLCALGVLEWLSYRPTQRLVGLSPGIVDGIARRGVARGRADIKLVLIGDGKLKPTLQARALAEGLDNVVFHPPVGKGKLAGLMAATDVGLRILANVPAIYYGTSMPG